MLSLAERVFPFFAFTIGEPKWLPSEIALPKVEEYDGQIGTRISFLRLDVDNLSQETFVSYYIFSPERGKSLQGFLTRYACFGNLFPMANAHPQQPNLVGGWDISEDRLVIPLPILAVGNKPVTKVEELKKESRPKWYINSWTARPGTDAMVSHALKISESCRQLSTLAFRKQLAAGDILELLEYAWEKLFAFDSTLLRTYERSNDLTRFLEHVGIWMSTNSLTERYRAFINSIYQRPRQSIVDFFEFYLVNVRPMTSGDETQWNLARTFYLRLTEEYRNERQYALDTILKPILFFHIDTGDLTNAQKSHITLDRLEQALLNPLNSTRLALPKHLAGGGGDNVLKKPRRDTDGDGGAPAPFGRGRGNFIRGTGRGRSVSGRGRGFSDRNFGGGSKQDFPASRYEAAAPPAKRSAGFACYVCGSPDHGINEHPMDDAKRAYLARRDDRGTVGRGRGFTPKPKFQQMSGKQKAESYQNQAKRLLQKAAEILTPDTSSPKPERTDHSSRISNFQISEMLEMLNKRATIYVAKSGELRTVAGSEVNRDGKLVEFSGESAKHRQLLSMGYDMLPPDIFAARTEIVSSTVELTPLSLVNTHFINPNSLQSLRL